MKKILIMSFRPKRRNLLGIKSKLRLKKKIHVVCVGVLALNLQLLTPNSFSQNVGINSDGASPESNTMLEVKSTDNSSSSFGLKVKDSSGNNKLVVRSDGNVGINTSNPTKDLDITVNRNSDTGIRILNNDGGTLARSRLMIGQVEGSSNYMYIEHLGTNFATPVGSGLRIANRTVIHGDDTQGMVLMTYNASAPMIFATGGADVTNERVRITSAGNVGIGTMAPSSKLEVCGDTRIVGQINANSSNLTAGLTCSSDKRLKKNIEPISNALNQIDNIEGKTYYWKAEKYKDRGFSDQKQYGFIAQELEKVIPELVQKGGDGFKSINYIELIPILTEAIKELKAKNARLETEMDDLSARFKLIEEHLKTANK